MTPEESLHEAIAALKEQVGTWGRDDFHAMRNEQHAMAARLGVIGKRMDTNAEQRDRMERVLTEIERGMSEINRHLGDLNHRTEKSEDAIEQLRLGQQTLQEVTVSALSTDSIVAKLAESLAAQPDGTIHVVTPAAPSGKLTKTQTAGVAGIAAVVAASLPGVIELLKQIVGLLPHAK